MKSTKRSTSKSASASSAPSRTTSSLRCRVIASFAHRASDVVQSLKASVLPYPTDGETSIDVLVCDAFARFSALTPHGEPAWTIVRRGDSRAASIWDPGQRKAWRLSDEEVPAWQVMPPLSLRVTTRSGKLRSTAELQLSDPAVGLVKIELRFSRDPSLARHASALLKLLYGGVTCHRDSGFPHERLSRLGCLESATIRLGDETAPIAWLAIRDAAAVRVSADEFEIPAGYTIVERGKVPPGPDIPAPPPPVDLHPVDPPSALDGNRIPLADTRSNRQALEFEEMATPDCLGSTRLGSMAITVHQDVLDQATRAINAAASLLGTAPINGSISINWLADLRTIRAGSAVAPGTGLLCVLEDRRTPATASTPASGGTAYLDQIAVRALFDRCNAEVVTGALLNSMHSWGITNNILIGNVFAAHGNLRDTSITTNQRILIADSFTTATYGSFVIDGLPREAHFKVPGFFEADLWSLVGSINFASLGGAPLLPTAAIGSSGDVLLTVNVPTTTLTATVTWKLLPLADAALNAITLLSCIFLPLTCAFAVPANLLLKQFLETQLDVLTATTAGLTIAFDVQFGFDANTGIVGPDVKILSSTGTVALLSTSAGAPSVILGAANFILLAVQANLQTLWMAALTTALKLLLTDQLRNLGLECPLGATPLGLTAASGSAESIANSRLTLFAEMVHDPATPSHPFAVQVPTGETLARQLELCHAAMRSDLLAPVPPSPGKPPSPPPIGVYGGIALSQNAINQYADVQWRSGAFRWDTADGTEIAKLLALSPKVATLFPRSIHRIHAWLSASPRIELAEGGFANLDLPLVAYLDDLRICFQAIGPSDHDVPGSTPMLELSANASVSAAVVLDGLTPRILFDRTTVAIDDERVWAIADPNLPMLQVVPSDWRALVLYVATSLLVGWDAANRPLVPTAPPPWRRPLPATAQQQLVAVPGKGGLAPQDGYFEQLASRRALYLLPAFRSQLLELVDGSGAPTLTSLVRPAMAGAPPPVPVTITNLTCPEGASLRIVFDRAAVIPP